MAVVDSTPGSAPRDRASPPQVRSDAGALFWRLLPGLVVALALGVAGARWIASNWDAGTASARLSAVRALFSGDTVAAARPQSSTPAGSLTNDQRSDLAAPNGNDATAAVIDPVLARVPPNGAAAAAAARTDSADAQVERAAVQPVAEPPARRPSAAVAPPARRSPPASSPPVDPAASAARRARIAAELERKLGPPVRPISGVPPSSTPARTAPEDD